MKAGGIAVQADLDTKDVVIFYRSSHVADGINHTLYFS